MPFLVPITGAEGLMSIGESPINALSELLDIRFGTERDRVRPFPDVDHVLNDKENTPMHLELLRSVLGI
jgi:hypothetical protein